MNIGDNLRDIINILSLINKDDKKKILNEKITKSYRELLEDEVKGRRIKSSELIKEMVMIDIALKEFELKYNSLKKRSGLNIIALNNYIEEIKSYRKKLSNKKKYLSRV